MMLGVFREEAGINNCKSCARLEALVKLEHERGNEYMGLLHEANDKINRGQASYELLLERFLLATNLIPKDKISSESKITMAPFGGIETLRQKQERLSNESKKRRAESRNTEAEVAEAN